MTKLITGADISFLDEVLQAGGKFYDEGVQADCLSILTDHGMKAVRLRIWNDPAGGFCDLERTLHMARQVKEKGMHLLLCFHYSDLWADPKHQTKPKAWEGLDFTSLKQALYDYTEQVLGALKAQGTTPDMVQIGNEITRGIVWDEGCVSGNLSESDKQWQQLTELVKKGIAAVKKVDPSINIMIHIDQGGDNATSRKFLDQFERYGVQFDTIGLSFYPWWHGTLKALENNIADLISRYGRDIIIVELAYPWTITNLTSPGMIVDKEDQLHEGYPATIEGQAAYMRDLIALMKSAPEGKCIGFYYWEPAWIPCQEEWSVGHHNNWSNLTLFDYDGNKLKAMDAIRDAVSIWKE